MYKSESTTSLWLVATILSGALTVASCSGDHQDACGSGAGGVSTSLFVATDRHEAGSGNNLMLAVQTAVGLPDAVAPRTVLLGGDYVGCGSDQGATGQPAFTLDDVRSEIFSTLSPDVTQVLFTYGSHDRSCTDGYPSFFSGPRSCTGYYVYGVSYAQMVFDTDSLARAAVALYERLGESGVDAGGLRAYNGIDVADTFGISAETAAARFSSWVTTLTDHAPIVVMSHVPIHAHRNDNHGGLRWYEALSHAARTHDVILFFGHNHTMEEWGNSTDRYVYLLTPGDSISVQGGSTEGVQRRRLNFTYANAGYLKLGWSTLVTFTDTNRDGRYDQVRLRRFSILGDDDSGFGLTGKPNPYTLKLSNH